MNTAQQEPLRSFPSTGTSSDVNGTVRLLATNPSNSYNPLAARKTLSIRAGVLLAIIIISVAIGALMGGAVGGVIAKKGHKASGSGFTSITTILSAPTSEAEVSLSPFPLTPTTIVPLASGSGGGSTLNSPQSLLLAGAFQTPRKKQEADPPRPTTPPQ